MAEPFLEELGVEECLRLLGERDFGRLAVDDGRGPVILPVNYRFQQGTVLIRTADGTKLHAAEHSAWASFEIDGVDGREAGWSVVVRGRLRPLFTPPGATGDGSGEPQPYPAGDRQFLIGLMPGRITGSRFGHVQFRRTPVATPAGSPPHLPPRTGQNWLPPAT